MIDLQCRLFKFASKVSVTLFLAASITGQSNASTTFIISSQEIRPTTGSTAHGRITFSDSAPDSAHPIVDLSVIESFRWDITGGSFDGTSYVKADLSELYYDRISDTFAYEFTFSTSDGIARASAEYDTSLSLNHRTERPNLYRHVVSPIPEPEQYLMLILGLAGMFGYARYKRRI